MIRLIRESYIKRVRYLIMSVVGGRCRYSVLQIKTGTAASASRRDYLVSAFAARLGT